MTEIRRSQSGWLFPAPGGMGADVSSARAINDNGMITGWYGTEEGRRCRGFVWKDGRWSDVGLFGARDNLPLGINRAGVVVGQCHLDSVDRSGHRIAVGFRSDGRTTETLRALPGYDHSRASAVNDGGAIAGCVYNLGRDGRPVARRAVTWDPSGAVGDLGTLGGTNSAAFGLNAAGDVVGVAETVSGDEHAFLCQEGAMTDLGTLGGRHSTGRGINEAGQVVGGSDLGESGQHRAFLWERGVMWNLGTIGGRYSEAFALNDSGTVVGCSETASGERHAFMAPAGMLIDLGTFGGSYSAAYAVNENEDVVGEAGTITESLRAFWWHHGQMHDLGVASSEP